MKARRKRALVGVAAIAAAFLITAAAIVGHVSPAAAHGVAMFPGSRTYLCYVDGLRDNGEIIPYNPACADAVAQSGTTPLYNWFAVLDSNANGRNVGYVPDGTICSAGNKSPYDFSPYNMARTDWPVTHLTSGATIQWWYSNWAQHPGTFHMYITKDGWDPNQPLAWSDLESFWSVTNPPQSGPAGEEGNYYYWDAQLPAGKSGRHMIFIQWVRSDSPENFFSCSDVVFDGGNGEVTGIGPDQGSPSPTPSPTSSPSPPPPPPSGGAVKAQYENNDTAPSDNQIKPGLQLVNTGTASLDLSTVTIRYWFTGDAGTTSYSMWCDYAVLGCGNLTQNVVALSAPRAGADHYLAVGFTAGAGSLAAGASTGDIQNRFNKTDWSMFDESNDYSWSGTQTTYADWSKVTVYVNGALAWGTEP